MPSKLPSFSNQTRLHFLKGFPPVGDLRENGILVFDRSLLRRVKGFRKWSEAFPVRYPVRAGEALKDIAGFPKHIEKLLKISENLPASRMTIVAVGGGSVGDFAGFMASVLKRGVRLVHIPSTWLSAIDSAHGGKTALNAGGVKNPVGTFFSASDVYLSQALLFSQPQERAQEAFGEFSKIALLDARLWTEKMRESRLRGPALLWKFLPAAIDSKYRVIRRDPFEKLGLRRILNLGHTLGHILEAHHGMAHGKAVSQGILFSLGWSAHLGLMNWREHVRLTSWLQRQFGIHTRAQKPVSRSRFLALLKQDKKKDSSSGVQFVFLRKAGQPVIQQVSWKDFLDEARRQGWVR